VDRRQEPPNPREPIELLDADIGKKQVAERAANIANHSQQQQKTAAASMTAPVAAQVHCSLSVLYALSYHYSASSSLLST